LVSGRGSWTVALDESLAFGALGTIILQGILGGVTVLHFLPPAISSAHAAVAQTFSASQSRSPSSLGTSG
jgi:hypothetical protein